jgi:pantoate kinase
MRRKAPVRRSRAFAPGHVTGVFRPDLSARDPRGRGSVGAGVVLELGAVASVEWTPDVPRSIRISSDVGPRLPITREVAERLLGEERGGLRIRLHHELPVGQGFGMSAAGSTATALAVASVLRISPHRAVGIAHLAELHGGGGLGGVAAILGGGLEVRVRPGIPPFGRILHRAFPFPLFIAVTGVPMPSPPLLRDPTFLARVSSAAAPEIPRLAKETDPRSFLAAAERFGDTLGLSPPRLARAIRKLRDPDVRASQAMFGRSVFAVPLSDRGRRRILRQFERLRWRAVELNAMPARRGASLVPERRAAAG